MKKILCNTIILLGITVIIEIFAIHCSLKTHEWHWFGRSGSIVVLFGGILSSRRLFRMGLKNFFKHETTVNGGNFIPKEEEKKAEKQLRKDIQAAQIGIYVIIVGTLIWGFGDLFSQIIN